MPALDLAALRATPLVRDPFDYAIVPGFVRADALPSIHADFPAITGPGSFPAEGLRYGPAFASLLAELRSPALAAAFGALFGLDDLVERPTMITVRGHTQAKDGRIHTDSATKIVTVLLYLNESWENAGGRLRLLRRADDIEDYVAEVPPDAGTMLAFRRSDRSFHGHRPFVGPRRAIQLNWVTGADIVRREIARHRLSAAVKRLNPFA